MKITIAILMSLIAIVFTTGLFLGQFRTIEIEGKGNSGHERSLSHPFICRTGSFTDHGFNYCDYKTFFRKVF